MVKHMTFETLKMSAVSQPSSQKTAAIGVTKKHVTPCTRHQLLTLCLIHLLSLTIGQQKPASVGTVCTLCTLCVCLQHQNIPQLYPPQMNFDQIVQ